MSRTRQKVEVIVMGAAIAGLASARDLSIDGFDVLVLEARNRIGGRIWTSRDLGARASDRHRQRLGRGVPQGEGPDGQADQEDHVADRLVDRGEVADRPDQAECRGDAGERQQQRHAGGNERSEGQYQDE